ncbi:PREDICTED: olfactory receptor 1361-like [Nanorana parkeri]|uniref:olfactory receptor 1361-like n=1 Tax=Nanorana parkeri TaxID=125878 RepID=UPI000853F0C2|nr:PREDICTED: olfactory receptor 1361-like [Nanorana parkeri]
MNLVNVSTVTEFFLLGLSHSKDQQMPLFALFFTMYLVTVLGNLLIVAVIGSSQELHNPMYFFLGNLSFVDICFSSVTAPLMLRNLLWDRKTICFEGCMSQLFFLFFTGSMECFVLAVMAYDRLVAINNPLRYLYIMHRRMCLALIVFSWTFTALHSLLHISIVASMTFCGPNKIHEYFCDLPPLLALSCSDTSQYDLLVFTEGSFVTMSPFVFVVISYCRILKTILKIQSSTGRYQAFSTCSSHLTSVGLFFGTIFFTYFRPSSSSSVEDNRSVTVVYSVLTPLLNPFIYSLRNQQIKAAVKKIYHRMFRINTKDTGKCK